jgi:hypothetical protein
MGAFMDLSVRRTQVAADDIFKGACRKPKRFVTTRTFDIRHFSLLTELFLFAPHYTITHPHPFFSTSSSVKAPKIKNITKTVLGETVGRIHMKKQNFDKMGGRKVTALREKRTISEDPNSGSNKGGKRRRIG